MQNRVQQYFLQVGFASHLFFHLLHSRSSLSDPVQQSIISPFPPHPLPTQKTPQQQIRRTNEAGPRRCQRHPPGAGNTCRHISFFEHPVKYCMSTNLAQPSNISLLYLHPYSYPPGLFEHFFELPEGRGKDDGVPPSMGMGPES